MSIHIPSSIHFVKNAYVVQLDLYPDSCRLGNDNLTYFLRGSANLILCLEERVLIKLARTKRLLVYMIKVVEGKM